MQYDKKEEIKKSHFAIWQTACTRITEKGMEQRILQEIMRHLNLAVTMKVCNHVDEKRMRNEMDKLDAVRVFILELCENR